MHHIIKLLAGKGLKKKKLMKSKVSEIPEFNNI